MPYDKYYAARDLILDFITKDAFGPIKKDEILQEPPLDTYVCGILWPKRTLNSDSSRERSAEYQLDSLNELVESEIVPDQDFGADVDEEQSDVIREANQFRPSVMAISFALKNSETEVNVEFTTAVYLNIDKPVEGKSYVMHEYERTPLSTERLSISLTNDSFKTELFGGRAVLQIVKRRVLNNDTTLWTISVENTKYASQNEIDQNTSALFQCRLELYGKFCYVDNLSKTAGDLDRKKQDFLYRKVHTYAVGHGCSVKWEKTDNEVKKIESTFLPQSVISQMIAVTDESVSCFRMASWKDEWRESGLQELSSYVRKYRGWKETISKELVSVPQSFKSVAESILDRITECADRLDKGIKVLENNDIAWQAFCLMNKAMMRQSAKKRAQAEEAVSWYPFQLCYVLMCIPDMVDGNSQWRNTVDLLWFPTGGGKTEAYLGVAAFTIFFRRLTKKEQGSGVTVLMRYTLRMLTSQQYERAAALICECDLIRREEGLPGGEISIGLWVGGEVTPNHVTSDNSDLESAETILDKLKAGQIDEVKSSPVQLTYCPYCGTELHPQNSYSIEHSQFKTHCPNEKCPFHNELPVVTVDDDIYERRPTLLIGTIDKFARLAWEEKTKAIFAEDGIGLPPDLLIQDELHLISGPLGSISGLYEIAIEKLCQQGGIGPKILASTATLCNANEQIRALYGRPAFQFPPSGFDAEDSFFARTANSEERPQRTYIGYCETGGSLQDSVVRVFGVVRFALQYMACSGVDEKIIDHFWTNVGYFNSLKDLGSADTLIIDRVFSYAESLRRHKFQAEAERVKMPRISNEYEYGELTSRKSSREITDVRNQLDKQHYPSPAALDYVLSSNMLSVGIDINRLGLMTVYGQPKATAEYIQATSRVGRSNPGLVVVLLHMLRTRDKSHYEQFPIYHQALNKMVEPTSATPYACRALDKVLHSVFVTLVRHQCNDLSGNKDAEKFRKNRADIVSIRNELLDMIGKRSEETSDYAKEILNDFIDQWNFVAINHASHFQYQLLNRSEENTDALLVPAERSENAIFPPTMNSMRNVDTQSGVFLKRRSQQ